MTVWIGSDFHWGHKNILSFCPITRAPYRDVQHMSETMILEWNSLVKPEDTIYLLGDVAFMSGYEAARVLSRLNGIKILVAGNHDVKTLKVPAFRDSFEEVHDYLEIIYDGVKICMCHYPIFDHNGAGRGSIMLHGHRHGNPHGIPGKIMDVGMDSTGVILTPMDDIIKKMEKIPHMHHHPSSLM
jgi:calcineurin-like phosphoesterase family protein